MEGVNTQAVVPETIAGAVLALLVLSLIDEGEVVVFGGVQKSFLR